MKWEVLLVAAAAYSAFIGVNDEEVRFGGALDSIGLSSEQKLFLLEAWDKVGAFPDWSPNSHPKPKKETCQKEKVAVLGQFDDYDVFDAQEFNSYSLRTKKTKLGLDTVKQYSGYFDIRDADRHLFYYFLESRNDPENDPLIFWINGGPGCSTMGNGLLFELGPSFIGKDLKPIYNPYSWNSNASIVFLDQPVGTGFSYGNDTIDTSANAAKDVYVFLELFFRKFPQFRNSKFHISGESYAGHYLPAITTEIIHHPERSFEVDSVLLGNGYVYPLYQEEYDYDMLCGSGGLDIFTEEECAQMKEDMPKCRLGNALCSAFKNPLTCVPADYYCDKAFEPLNEKHLNPYDLRRPCGDNPLCYDDMNDVTSYLNDPEIKDALGVPQWIPFEFCSDEVGQRFSRAGDSEVHYDTAIAEIVDYGIPVLLFAGDKDFKCHWVGFNAVADIVEYQGHEQFQATPFTPWKVDGEQVGAVRNYGNLTFLRVFEAGHMVPHDKPKVAFNMLETWLAGDYSFGS